MWSCMRRVRSVFLRGRACRRRWWRQAAALGLPAMALLDRNGVYGAARFHTMAKRGGVRAHVGAEIAVSDLPARLRPPAWLPHQHVAEPSRLPVLCASRVGYQNLSQLITRFKMREEGQGRGGRRRSRTWEEFAARAGVSDGR